jgi:hypothetical protein
MSHPPKAHDVDVSDSENTRQTPEANNFENLARALFRVDKRDVDKHEPKKRSPKDAEIR